MKKIFLIVAVLMLTSPVMAQTTFSAVAEMTGDPCGVVAIYYDATAEANRPRAFALDFVVTDGNVLAKDFNVSEDGSVMNVFGEAPGGNILDVYDVNEHFNIYPGTIVIIDGDVNDYGTPVSPNDFPGTQPGIGTPAVTIEMGSLYVGEANAPPRSGLLCRVKVEAGASDKLYVHANVIRALTGVVLEDANDSPTNVEDSLWTHIFPRFLEGDVASAGRGPHAGLPDNVIDGYDQDKINLHWGPDGKPFSPFADVASAKRGSHKGWPDGVVDGYDQDRMNINWD